MQSLTYDNFLKIKLKSGTESRIHCRDYVVSTVTSARAACAAASVNVGIS